MRYLILSALLSCPLPLAAADWALRPTDEPFSQAELESLPGQSFVFYDDGESIYGADGAYSYTYSIANGAGTAWGSYHIVEDGSVCVHFVTGAERCDFFVRNGSRVLVITEEGERFPVR